MHGVVFNFYACVRSSFRSWPLSDLPVELVQHLSQISILLLALKKENRI